MPDIEITSKDAAMEIAEQNLAKAVVPFVNEIEQRISVWLGPPMILAVKLPWMNTAVKNMISQLYTDEGWDVSWEGDSIYLR